MPPIECPPWNLRSPMPPGSGEERDGVIPYSTSAGMYQFQPGGRVRPCASDDRESPGGRIVDGSVSDRGPHSSRSDAAEVKAVPYPGSAPPVRASRPEPRSVRVKAPTDPSFVRGTATRRELGASVVAMTPPLGVAMAEQVPTSCSSAATRPDPTGRSAASADVPAPAGGLVVDVIVVPDASPSRAPGRSATRRVIGPRRPRSCHRARPPHPTEPRHPCSRTKGP